jgi:hypothetical protein
MIDEILKFYLKRDQFSLNKVMLKWIFERNIPMNRLDISEQYGFYSMMVTYLRSNFNSIQHLRIHGCNDIHFDDALLGRAESERQSYLRTVELMGYQGSEILSTRLTQLLTIDFTGCGRNIDNYLLEKISRNNSSSSKILLCGCKRVSNDGLMSLASAQMTFVDVGGTRVTERGILEFGKLCPNLSSLGSYCVSDELIEKLCMSISEHHPLSEFMGDDRVRHITDFGLSILSTPQRDEENDYDLPVGFIGRPNQTTIRIYSTMRITDLGLSRLAGKGRYRGCKLLAHVTFYKCHFLSDNGIKCLVKFSIENKNCVFTICTKIYPDPLSFECKI